MAGDPIRQGDAAGRGRALGKHPFLAQCTRAAPVGAVLRPL